MTWYPEIISDEVQRLMDKEQQQVKPINWQDNPAQVAVYDWLMTAGIDYYKLMSGRGSGVAWFYEFHEEYVLRPGEVYDPENPKMTADEFNWFISRYEPAFENLADKIDDAVLECVESTISDWWMPADLPPGLEARLAPKPVSWWRRLLEWLTGMIRTLAKT
jgi:hypothetical protein